jgi:hypothetical protein
MTGAQPYPRLGLGGFPQHPLEGKAPAVQPGRHAGLIRQDGRHGPGRQQAIPGLGHLCLQRLGDLLTEKVRVMELHHALAVPPPAAGRPGIPVDRRDLVPPRASATAVFSPVGPAPAMTERIEDPFRLRAW